MNAAFGTGSNEDDNEVRLRPAYMVAAATLVVIAAIGLFLASTIQAVHLIDQRTVDTERGLVARLLADYPTTADATPAARALHVAALAGLHNPHIGTAVPIGTDEVGEPLPGAAAMLIWSPRGAANEVFAEVAPYRLIIVGMLIPVLLVVLLRFRAFTTELDRQRRVARQQAARDSLTGLANRMVFDQRLSAELGKRGQSESVVALMLLDLNGFKQVNDTLGHAAGDAVLVEMAARLRQLVPPPALAARLGGDEFAVILRLDKGTEALFELVLDLHAALAEPYIVRGHQVDAPASIGIALAPEHGDGVDELLRHADAALYAAKARPDRPFLMFDRKVVERSGPIRAAAAGAALH